MTTLDDLRDAANALAAVRCQGNVRYYVSDLENWILDWTRWRDEFVAAGYAVPAQVGTAGQRDGTQFVDERHAARFPDARYGPAGWPGEFGDFANSHPAGVCPAAATFWIADGKDLPQAAFERGRRGDTESPEAPCPAPS